MTTTSPTVTRGVVLIRTGQKPSAVLGRAEAERMQRRFGGRIVNAAGLPYRTVQGRRVITDAAGLAARVAP